MKHIRKNIKLYFAVILGYIILFLGSWATFFIGSVLFIPILIGIESIVFAYYRNEVFKMKDVFGYMNKSSRGEILSHYMVLGIIYALLFAAMSAMIFIYQGLIGTIIPDNLTASLISISIIVIIYISLQTVFSFATIIKMDRDVSTSKAISLSKDMVYSKPLYFIRRRLLFFFRNIAINTFIIIQILYYNGIIDAQDSISGDPAAYSMYGWFLLLILSTPLYEKMMVKSYLKHKNTILMCEAEGYI